jgi:hypothetical protein
MRRSDPVFAVHQAHQVPFRTERYGPPLGSGPSTSPVLREPENHRERGLSIESIAAAHRRTAPHPRRKRLHRPTRLRGSNAPSFHASSRGVTRDGGPREDAQGYAHDGLRERRSSAEKPSAPEHLQLPLGRLTGIQPRREGKSSR